MRIAVAGSSGFIGRRLINQLARTTSHEIVALSRSGAAPHYSKVTGIATDFFSLMSAELALIHCDVAFYLLHSMIPSNRLSQGNFEDFDFILADNFARAARKAGVKKIIFVGGIVEENNQNLSQHLRSRLEVEKVLGSYGILLITLRCSLVIGAEGSSFLILKKLVTRLPSMIIPPWCNTPCQPVAADDLVQVLCILADRQHHKGCCYDLGSPELFTYRKLIELTAEVAGLQRKFVSISNLPIFLSKLWVRLVTGASKSLVYPLIESLGHPMTVRPQHRIDADLLPAFIPIRDVLAQAMQLNANSISPFGRGLSTLPSHDVIESSLVKSVQRLTLPLGMDAFLAARYYFKWLSRFFNGIINVQNSRESAYFYFIFLKKPLLELTYSPDRSARDRQLFYITGGILAAKNDRGRLEFRESPTRKHLFAAIHDYKPSLPWWIYRTTQAPVHRFVMWSFGRFLERIDSKNRYKKLNREKSQRFFSKT